ncbi:SKI family transcriptional corepressor 1-like [Lethenteron reissneri]|uniref:SKI family transcriptional corepressor 1-like n=1 Tax=Lethenteron reissneri TaxID=7753 RepID=UPI002AB6598C|nr:SKI family transcriptional corepressor 1-like [Lethenteron reissneri]
MLSDGACSEAESEQDVDVESHKQTEAEDEVEEELLPQDDAVEVDEEERDDGPSPAPMTPVLGQYGRGSAERSGDATPAPVEQHYQPEITRMDKEELQKFLLHEMDLRRKIERELQSLKACGRKPENPEKTHHAIEGSDTQSSTQIETLCGELDRERKARHAVQQQKLKGNGAT